MKLYNMVKAFNLVVRFLDETTYSYDIVSAITREDRDDFEFVIVEYDKLGNSEEYDLYVDINNEGNQILNSFGDPVVDYAD